MGRANPSSNPSNNDNNLKIVSSPDSIENADISSLVTLGAIRASSVGKLGSIDDISNIRISSGDSEKGVSISTIDIMQVEFDDETMEDAKAEGFAPHKKLLTILEQANDLGIEMHIPLEVNNEGETILSRDYVDTLIYYSNPANEPLSKLEHKERNDRCEGFVMGLGTDGSPIVYTWKYGIKRLPKSQVSGLELKIGEQLDVADDVENKGFVMIKSRITEKGGKNKIVIIGDQGIQKQKKQEKQETIKSQPKESEASLIKQIKESRAKFIDLLVDESYANSKRMRKEDLQELYALHPNTAEKGTKVFSKSGVPGVIVDPQYISGKNKGKAITLKKGFVRVCYFWLDDEGNKKTSYMATKISSLKRAPIKLKKRGN